MKGGRAKGIVEGMSSLVQTARARARQAAKIARDPSKYKICEGCDSIVMAKVHTCPNCASYRFEEGAEAVVRQAQLLGSRERRSVLPEDLS